MIVRRRKTLHALRHVAHAQGYSAHDGPRRHVAAIEKDRTGTNLQYARDGEQRGRLSGPIASDDGDQLSRGDLNRDIADGNQVAESGRDRLHNRGPDSCATEESARLLIMAPSFGNPIDLTLAEIALGYVRAIADHVRRSGGGDRPHAQDMDDVGTLAHQRQAVLDQHGSYTERSNVGEGRSEDGDIGLVQPRGRLVEQNDTAVRGQGAPDLEEPPVTQRQIDRRLVGQVANPELPEDGQRGDPVRARRRAFGVISNA
jgi:hypothetical protein